MRVLAQQHGIEQVVILAEGPFVFLETACIKFWILQKVMIPGCGMPTSVP